MLLILDCACYVFCSLAALSKSLQQGEAFGPMTQTCEVCASGSPDEFLMSSKGSRDIIL